MRTFIATQSKSRSNSTAHLEKSLEMDVPLIFFCSMLIKLIFEWIYYIAVFCNEKVSSNSWDSEQWNSIVTQGQIYSFEMVHGLILLAEVRGNDRFFKVKVMSNFYFGDFWRNRFQRHLVDKVHICWIYSCFFWKTLGVASILEFWNQGYIWLWTYYTQEILKLPTYVH